MAYTFYDSVGHNGDNLSLTKYIGKSGICLQISTVRFLESLSCKDDERESQFLPGHSAICLNRDEVVMLRDQLNRFLDGDYFNLDSYYALV